MRLFYFFLSTLCLSASASAFELDWSGRYRLEYTEVDNTSLAAGMGRKSYVLNHLELTPKIIAVDGVTITSRIELLPNQEYPESSAGQQFGLGTNRGTETSQSPGNSNVESNTQGSTPIYVRELYLQIAQEYGNFVAGRFPLEFGLGMTYSAGHGTFDHWSTVEDLVGYKFIVGNFSAMAMIGKPYHYSPSQGREVTDLMAIADYNNPETESELAIFYQKRDSSTQSNDAANVLPPDQMNGQPTSFTVTNGWSTQNVNVFLSRGWERFKFKIEGGVKSGTTGITNTLNDEIKESGYGVALELGFPSPGSKWDWNLRAGMASGDNPQTSNYEGFAFNRNYDVAFLLFNHPLGTYDVLRSNVQRDRIQGTANVYPNEEALDEEAISNAVYLSPKYDFHFSERWTLTQALTYAQTQVNPSTTAGNSVGTDLGYELDTGLTFRPHERITWLNQLGLFLPGTAFREGSVGRENGFTFGAESKLAITF